MLAPKPAAWPKKCLRAGWMIACLHHWSPKTCLSRYFSPNSYNILQSQSDSIQKKDSDTGNVPVWPSKTTPAFARPTRCLRGMNLWHRSKEWSIWARWRCKYWKDQLWDALIRCASHFSGQFSSRFGPDSWESNCWYMFLDFTETCDPPSSPQQQQMGGLIRFISFKHIEGSTARLATTDKTKIPCQPNQTLGC